MLSTSPFGWLSNGVLLEEKPERGPEEKRLSKIGLRHHLVLEELELVKIIPSTLVEIDPPILVVLMVLHRRKTGRSNFGLQPSESRGSPSKSLESGRIANLAIIHGEVVIVEEGEMSYPRGCRGCRVKGWKDTRVWQNWPLKLYFTWVDFPVDFLTLTDFGFDLTLSFPFRIDLDLGSTSGIRACALRNFDLEVMELENTQNNALAKLPMLKLREYEMWEIRIKQYFQIQDYALWRVLGELKFLGTYSCNNTTRNWLQKLVSRLAILGVVTPPKDLNVKFLRSLPSEWDTHIVVWMNKPNFDTMGLDDLYNNFKNVEHKVKKSAGASNDDKNLAFVTTLGNVCYRWCLLLIGSGHEGKRFRVNMALMALSDSEVKNDKSCLKNCLKNYEALKKQYDDLLVKLSDTGFKAATYKRGLATLEDQIVKYKEHEVLFSEEIALLKRSVGSKEYELGLLRTELEKVKQETEGVNFKIAKFDKSTKDLNEMLERHITDKSKKGVGYNAVPSPHPLILNRPTTLDYLNYRKNNDAPIIEDWVSDDEEQDGSKTKPEKKTVILLQQLLIIDKPCTQTYGSKSSLNEDWLKSFNIARPVNTLRPFRSTVNTIKARGFNVIKPSACWVWRPIKPNGASLSNSQLNDKGLVDSGCSRHMTGNIAHLSDFKDFDGGYVTFGGGAYGGRITGRNVVCSSSVGFNTTQQMVISSPCLIDIKKTTSPEQMATALASPKQMAIGKDYSNPLMAGSLPKTIHCDGNNHCYIDGQSKTITEASLRRRLKLEDHDGITSIPNSEIFEQLALMGYFKTDFREVKSFSVRYHVPSPNESPLHAVHLHGSDERKIYDIDEDPNTYFAQDGEVVHDKDTAEEGQPEDNTTGITVSTAPINISTARETSSTVGRVVYGRRSKEARKDKGKAIMDC
ncbi:hypothetical protein Tco_0656690 [Tanacetum coccineum]|uniref:Uncharacterized protein n=1 Tax=Tanacetum coccineum TaxID=301880 RepID=A0ABQ4XAR1_9ASTR